jgi:hypothetical protein
MQSFIARTVVKRGGCTSSRIAYRRRSAQQFRQLGKVRRHAPRLVAGATTLVCYRARIGWRVHQTRRGDRFECDVLTVGRPHFLRASTHNSTSARWASKSSTGRNYRRCSDHGKTQDRRNNTTRHYTSSSAHSPQCRGLIPSNHKLARCCWAAMIAGQKAVAMPVIDVPLMSGRGERNGRQQ